MLTDKELAAVPEELLEDLLRYSEYRLAGETHCHAAGPPLSGGADGGGRAEAAPSGAEEAAPSLNRQREAPQGLLLLRMYSC